MKAKEKKNIEALADASVAKVRASRVAAHDLLDLQTFAAAPESVVLNDAALRADTAHANALSAVQDLEKALANAQVASLAQAAKRSIAAIQEAQTQVTAVKTAVHPIGAQLIQKLNDAEKNAVDLIQDTAAAFETAPEAAETTSFEGGLRSPSNLKEYLSVLAFTIIGTLAAFGSVSLFRAIVQAGPLFDKLAQLEFARGLITFILAFGTMLIALLLVLGALLGSEESKDNFTRGKEVLTVLIGVFGTILGFYFGSEKEQGALQMSPVAIATDGNNATLATQVTGGKPPYTYSIRFEPANVIDDVKDSTSEDGRIVKKLNTTKLNDPEAKDAKPVGFMIEISDSAKKRTSYQSTEREGLTRTKK